MIFRLTSFGGLKIEQVKRLKQLELETSRHREAVSDLSLHKLILTLLNARAKLTFSPQLTNVGWSILHAGPIKGGIKRLSFLMSLGE
jgi:hypothetical protein